MMSVGFLGTSVVKNPPTNTGDSGSNPGWRRSPGEGNGNPLQFFLPGKSHGLKSLAGYSPGGWKTVGYNLVTKQQQQW